jgi:hypothetical protein
MIITKGIDILLLEAQVYTSNDVPYISFTYDVYDNFNTDTLTWTSHNFYYGFSPLNQLSYNFASNIDATIMEYFQLNLGNHSFTFSYGEYQDLNGDPLNLGTIQTAITTALGL